MYKTKILAFYQSQAGLAIEEMKVFMSMLRVCWKKEERAGWISPKMADNWYTFAQSRRISCSWFTHTVSFYTVSSPINESGLINLLVSD